MKFFLRSSNTGLEGTRRPHAERRGRKVKEEPGENNPTSLAGGPMPRGRGPTPVGADTPWHTCTQSVLHSMAATTMARGPGWTPGGPVTSPAVTSPADRPAARPAGPRPGPARIGLSTRKRKRKEQEETAGKTGGTHQSVGQPAQG